MDQGQFLIGHVPHKFNICQDSLLDDLNTNIIGSLWTMNLVKNAQW